MKIENRVNEFEYEICAILAQLSNHFYPYSDFTCAGNIVLLPKDMAKPIDNSKAIKNLQ